MAQVWEIPDNNSLCTPNYPAAKILAIRYARPKLLTSNTTVESTVAIYVVSICCYF